MELELLVHEEYHASVQFSPWTSGSAECGPSDASRDGAGAFGPRRVPRICAVFPLDVRICRVRAKRCLPRWSWSFWSTKSTTHLCSFPPGRQDLQSAGQAMPPAMELELLVHEEYHASVQFSPWTSGSAECGPSDASSDTTASTTATVTQQVLEAELRAMSKRAATVEAEALASSQLSAQNRLSELEADLRS